MHWDSALPDMSTSLSNPKLAAKSVISDRTSRRQSVLEEVSLSSDRYVHQQEFLSPQVMHRLYSDGPLDPRRGHSIQVSSSIKELRAM